MAIDEALNKILKEMWRLDETIIHGEQLTEIEKAFYNEHLRDITKYYENNNQYWQNKTTSM